MSFIQSMTFRREVNLLGGALSLILCAHLSSGCIEDHTTNSDVNEWAGAEVIDQGQADLMLDLASPLDISQNDGEADRDYVINVSDMNIDDMMTADVEPQVDMESTEVDMGSTEVDMETLEVDMETLEVDMETIEVDMEAVALDMEMIELDMELPLPSPPCPTARASTSAVYADPNHPLAQPCGPLDPSCELSIDVLFVYTPSFLERLNGDERRVSLVVDQLIYEANLALTQSLLPSPYRYRVAGIEELGYQERRLIKSDLISLRFNPRLQALRASTGADVVFAILGTDRYGGLAYSTGSVLEPARHLAAIDGYFLTDEYERCATAYSTFAHEIGHLLGAGHRASMYRNPRGDAYGYHNQESHLRRNEAYGLAVDQRGEQFYTLMSYKSYQSPLGNLQGCVECEQLLAFASPNLWWLSNPEDPECEYVRVVYEHEGAPGSGGEPPVIERVDLQCQGRPGWERNWSEPVATPSFSAPMQSLWTLEVSELLARAVPLGVDFPTSIDPSDGVTQIEHSFQTRNREQVLERWPEVARLARRPALATECNLDCASLGRSACLVPQVCGPCLPDHSPEEIGGEARCLPRLELTLGDPIHDGQYVPTQVTVSSGGQLISVTPLIGPSRVSAIEVSLSTLDEDETAFFGWATVGPTTWVANAAPPHLITIYAECEQAESEERERFEWGSSQEGEGALADGPSQNNHSLHYRFSPPPNSRCVSVEVHLNAPLNLEDPTERYGFSVDEVRIFGEVEL